MQINYVRILDFWVITKVELKRVWLRPKSVAEAEEVGVDSSELTNHAVGTASWPFKWNPFSQLSSFLLVGYVFYFWKLSFHFGCEYFNIF